MNSVSIVGRLVFEPEVKTTKNGVNYISTRVAVDRHDQNKTTDFFTIRVYGKTCDFMSKYFHKGYPIEVMGKLQTESYTKQDGTKVDGVFILANEVGFVPQSKSETAPAESREAGADQTKSDLPFEI